MVQLVIEGLVSEFTIGSSGVPELVIALSSLGFIFEMWHRSMSQCILTKLNVLIMKGSGARCCLSE